MKQEEYWNSVSKEKEFTTSFQAGEFSKYVKKDSIILDVGCGYGRTLVSMRINDCAMCVFIYYRFLFFLTKGTEAPTATAQKARIRRGLIRLTATIRAENSN